MTDFARTTIVGQVDVRRMEVQIAIAKTGPTEGALLLSQHGCMTAIAQGILVVFVREIEFLRVMTDQEPPFGGGMGGMTPHAVALGNRLVD